MNGHLRLYLKPFGNHWKCLHKFIAESTVSCHNISDVSPEQSVDSIAHKTVAKIMERTLIFRKICGRQPVPHHHIRMMLQYQVRHFPCAVQGIGIIAVNHQVTFGIYFPKHPADHISLALFIFMAQHRSRPYSKFRSPVCGIIVIYINHRFRQRLPHITHHLFNGFFFVITGN